MLHPNALARRPIAVIGATGNTGSIVAETLLGQGRSVRVVLRHTARAADWQARGAEVAFADVADSDALALAFEGCAAAYLMNPPAYADEDLFARARVVHAALVSAIARAAVPRAVALSSIGAQHGQGTGNILTTHDFEEQLQRLTGSCEVTFLRAANFMENWIWSAGPARDAGVLPSMFQPLERSIPSVSAIDIGRTAAALLVDRAAGSRVVELHGPADYSPLDAAAAMTVWMKRPVGAFAPARAEWTQSFEGSGMSSRTVEAFCAMFDGFNTGHIAFEGTHETRRGTTTLEEALGAGLRVAPKYP